MTKFEEEFDNNVEIFDVIGNHNSMCCEVDQVKEVFKDWQPQQVLPVVPECVAEFIEDCKKEGDCLFGVFADATRVEHDMPDLVYFWLGDEGNNDELFARAWLDGYTVEKPQLFYIALPKVYGLSDSTFVSKAESGIISEFTKGKDYALKLTEQEIKSIDERYWQFAVPVEDNK